MFGPGTIDERFDTGELDHAIWTPPYLPAWSSREAARAAWSVDDEGLNLTIPPDHPVWCENLHEPPIRVSAIQSGNWSGPAGSTQGQQPFRKGLLVKEAQEPRWGFTLLYGHVEVACRAILSPRSMVSAWMVGLEIEPTQSGEICIMEIFGGALGRGKRNSTAASCGRACSGISYCRWPRTTPAGRGGGSDRRSRRCCPPTRWLCRTPRETSGCGPAGAAGRRGSARVAW